MRNALPPDIRVERLDPDLVPIYRAMTSAQRVEAGLSATDMIRERLQAAIREANPTRTDEVLARAVSRRMLGARD